MANVNIRERRHRLPREFYKGQVSAAFTLCFKGEIQSFIRAETVSTLTLILASIVEDAGCVVPVYCIMPDHQHLVLTGTREDSDIWNTMIRYKQRSGFWMAIHEPKIRWQKDFYDHVIRTHHDIATQVRYILDNPVRKGLVPFWQDYPFKGSIGCNIEDVLMGII